MARVSLVTVGLVVAFFTSQSSAQGAITAGVSIVSDSDYMTARPCIQTCIWYNGGLGRGGNSGFEDVGKALGCGQSPINACYCSSRLTSSATSYFSGCIRSLCTAVTDPADLSSALSIYGRYCGTAIVDAPHTTNRDSFSASTSGSASDSRTGSGNTVSTAAPTGGSTSPNASSGPSSTSSTGSTEQTSPSSSGLTTTSKIALGVGLGVGIPLLGLLTAILIILLRRGKSENYTDVGGIETSQRH
ncbi:hypothetical protein H072_4941 [Dactylellina haptotyla CBS 200.50]|uniref:Mid2 domain-containing protein n=1 Tax=Dactylellina haptotyla (strain CBS 200.50) TaxID=1284197 RepID=S8ADQ0_DACHA|nr:hypothetical protein H072_4941 [Dactylellina haptotyla CBS 200.50]